MKNTTIYLKKWLLLDTKLQVSWKLFEIICFLFISVLSIYWTLLHVLCSIETNKPNLPLLCDFIGEENYRVINIISIIVLTHFYYIVNFLFLICKMCKIIGAFVHPMFSIFTAVNIFSKYINWFAYFKLS